MAGRTLSPSLADPYLKTSRAKEHLECLRSEVDAFKKSKPYSIVREDDIEHDRHHIRLEVKDAPDRMNLIVGDLCYCLRSALDQVIWVLAKLNRPYPEHTQFPIIDAWNGTSRRTFERYTDGVPTGALKIIKSLQPCNRPDAVAIQSDPLWCLNGLCNIDKHRRIPVHGSVTDFHWPVKPEGGLPLLDVDHANATLTIPLSYKAYIALDPATSVNVVFGDLDAGVACDFAIIERIYNCVTDGVIPQFSRFFK